LVLAPPSTSILPAPVPVPSSSLSSSSSSIVRFRTAFLGLLPAAADIFRNMLSSCAVLCAQSNLLLSFALVDISRMDRRLVWFGLLCCVSHGQKWNAILTFLVFVSHPRGALCGYGLALIRHGYQTSISIPAWYQATSKFAQTIF
jgi:hypothetical protein